jgi:hypothetical protein
MNAAETKAEKFPGYIPQGLQTNILAENHQ